MLIDNVGNSYKLLFKNSYKLLFQNSFKLLFQNSYKLLLQPILLCFLSELLERRKWQFSCGSTHLHWKDKIDSKCKPITHFRNIFGPMLHLHTLAKCLVFKSEHYTFGKWSVNQEGLCQKFITPGENPVLKCRLNYHYPYRSLPVCLFGES